MNMKLRWKVLLALCVMGMILSVVTLFASCAPALPRVEEHRYATTIEYGSSKWYRLVDPEAGVACWSIYNKEGIACLPLSETNLNIGD
jgi:hypothetical protein